MTDLTSVTLRDALEEARRKEVDVKVEPNDSIKEIYKLVKLFLRLLLKDDADLNSLAMLSSINIKIKT